MSWSVFYYKIIILGSKKRRVLLTALLCSALLCSALLCSQQYCTAKRDVKFFFTAHTSFSLVLF